jgi:dephospho-CoA kinase
VADQIRLGVSGDASSGKDTTGIILEENFGCLHVSCSDLLRKFVTEAGLLPDRETMTRMGQQLRANLGASFLVDRCIETHNDVESLVLSGIYCPSEAQKFKNIGGHIIHVVCNNPLLRYERYLERQRILQRPETLTFEDFQEAFTRENTGESNQQDVAGVAQIADIVIVNEGTKSELADRVAEAYQTFYRSKNGTYYTAA